MYKIVSKLLANRMKKVMPLIIDETQSAFIGGHQLLHSVIIANEVIKKLEKTQMKCNAINH